MLRKIIVQNSSIFRRMAVWNKDIKPGPRPITKEEHLIAAKKYGLLPEDYKLIDPDLPLGDYPKVPDVPYLEKDPYEDWDCPRFRINFNDPLHHQWSDLDHIFQPDWYLKHKSKKYANVYGILSIVLPPLIAFLIFFSTQFLKFGKPYLPQQFPFKGEKHYTFEIED
ncbi:hypothetical protein A3Q56_08122 [Intoshia linei]|uniref:NADH dehydrogenase [ubiquinone] 1 beta subcomplex subunit 8, mitochondrial n=1 Tax=Intoshia linei TaxID=1819745 RepID=A0A177AQT1_9BILA|nr:hypothetical protein A3Q56_08122 [Intoshia linei]